jgi:hypothetical protein
VSARVDCLRVGAKGRRRSLQLRPFCGRITAVALRSAPAVAVEIAMSTASWCSRLKTPSPDCQVAHPRSRSC